MAAHVYNFPLKKLRLAIDMYKAQRRITCGAAVCSPVWTLIGVLAGCPVAMGAICLVLFSLMDQFMREVSTGAAS